MTVSCRLRAFITANSSTFCVTKETSKCSKLITSTCISLQCIFCLLLNYSKWLYSNFTGQLIFSEFPSEKKKYQLHPSHLLKHSYLRQSAQYWFQVTTGLLASVLESEFLSSYKWKERAATKWKRDWVNFADVHIKRIFFFLRGRKSRCFLQKEVTLNSREGLMTKLQSDIEEARTKI